MKRLVLTSLVVTVLALAATTAYAQSDADAVAELKNADGQVIGTVNLTETADGVRVTGTFSNLSAGEHGFHLHAVGKCEAPDFKSAGGHFNPEGKSHGLDNPDGPHAGDMPNLIVGDDGTASYEYVNDRVTLAEGASNSLFDADGSAVVIHAGPDDQMSDPAGDAGARVACGLIVATPAAMPTTGDAPSSATWLLVALGVLLLVSGLALSRRAQQR